MKIEIYNKNNVRLGENDLIGSGAWLILRDDQDNILYEYVFIKYGDVNGDGKINSLDVLVLQKQVRLRKPLG